MIRGLGCGSDRQSVESDEIFDSIAGLDFFGILFSQGIRSQSSQALIRTLNIYGLYHGWNLPNAADATEKLKPRQVGRQAYRRVVMAASDEAASDEVQLALAALTERIPIITRSVITKRGDYALSYLDCGCGRRSEQRMQTESRTLLECVSSLGELVEKKHATCIANRVTELETASASAAHRENFGILGTMMAEATAQ